MSYDSKKPITKAQARSLSNEKLVIMSLSADKALKAEIERLARTDWAFGLILADALLLDDEKERRGLADEDDSA